MKTPWRNRTTSILRLVCIAGLFWAVFELSYRPDLSETTISFEQADNHHDEDYITAVAPLFVPNVDCPSYSQSRYDFLRGKKLFIAMDLFNTQDVVPRLLDSTAILCSLVGSENCFISIIESRSNDKTVPLLNVAKDFFNRTSIPHRIISEQNAPDPRADNSRNRIKLLAAVRQRTMQPLYELDNRPDAILFINDVWLCPYHVFELLRLHFKNDADLSCGMDYGESSINGRFLHFYDNWVGRSMAGDLFDSIFQGGWSGRDELFLHQPETRSRYLRNEPFQVYSCWNGMIAVSAEPFLEHNVTFRAANLSAGECNHSEAQILSKDLWSSGFHKIMMIPTIKLGYAFRVAKFWNNQTIDTSHVDSPVKFIAKPPIEVRCQSLPERGGGPWGWDNMRWEQPVVFERYIGAGSPYGRKPAANQSIIGLYDDDDLDLYSEVKRKAEKRKKEDEEDRLLSKSQSADSQIVIERKRKAREAAELKEQMGRRKSSKRPPPATVNHPIHKLMDSAEKSFDRLLSAQTKTLEASADAYRKRRGRHPPPRFDVWWQFAKERNATIVEAFFDQIYSDLERFWSISPLNLRHQAHTSTSLTIRSGIVDSPGDHDVRRMIATFAEHLPDMNIYLNGYNEPSLIVPFEVANQSLFLASASRALPDKNAVKQEFTKLFSEPVSSQTVPDEHNLKMGWTTYRGDTGKHFWPELLLACPPDSAAVRHINATISYQLDGYIQDLAGSKSICDQPQLRYQHAALNVPSTTNFQNSLLAVFSAAKFSMNSDILIPPPMEYHLRIDPKLLDNSSWSAIDSPRLDGLVWRGSATGGQAIESVWQRYHRQRFVAMTNLTELSMADTDLQPQNWRYPSVDAAASQQMNHWMSGFLDTAFTRIHFACDAEQKLARQTASESLKAQSTDDCFLEHYFSTKDRIPLEVQQYFNYHIDVDGNAHSGRYLALLETHGLVLKSTILLEWLDSRLIPWKHFVPLDVSLDDFYPVLQFFSGGMKDAGHQDLAERIATDGARWAKEVLRPQDMEIYMFRLLLEFARLMEDDRETMGFVEDLLEVRSNGPPKR